MNQEPVNPSQGASQPAPMYQPAQPQIVYIEAPKQRRRWWQVGCGILVAMLVIGCVILSVGGVLFVRYTIDFSNQSDAIDVAVTQFCAAESAQNYALAYSYFSPAFKQRMSLKEFIQKSLATSQRDGMISKCEVDSNGNTQANGSNGSADILFARTSSGNPVSATIYLVSDGGRAWSIDNVSASLHLF